MSVAGVARSCHTPCGVVARGFSTPWELLLGAIPPHEDCCQQFSHLVVVAAVAVIAIIAVINIVAL